MSLYSIAFLLAGIGLETVIVFRGLRQRCFRQLPLFYSYVFYQLASTVIEFFVYWIRPRDYAVVFWLCFLVGIFAEFAVVVEVSDHAFVPYPVLRRLGRLLTLALTIMLFALYILPPLFSHGTSHVLILDLAKRSSLAKAVIILALLAAVRFYRLPLSSSVSGILLGFSVYLGTNIANFALDAVLPVSLYTPIFSTVGPLSFTLALLIWAIKLWQPEPTASGTGRIGVTQPGFPRPLGYRLTRFNATLTRLLGK